MSNWFKNRRQRDRAAEAKERWVNFSNLVVVVVVACVCVGGGGMEGLCVACTLGSGGVSVLFVRWVVVLWLWLYLLVSLFCLYLVGGGSGWKGVGWVFALDGFCFVCTWWMEGGGCIFIRGGGGGEGVSLVSTLDDFFKFSLEWDWFTSSRR